jgi:hypothetical protein
MKSIGNRTRDLQACNSVPQPTAPSCATRLWVVTVTETSILRSLWHCPACSRVRCWIFAMASITDRSLITKTSAQPNCFTLRENQLCNYTRYKSRCWNYKNNMVPELYVCIIVVIIDSSFCLGMWKLVMTAYSCWYKIHIVYICTHPTPGTTTSRSIGRWINIQGYS